MNKSILDIKSFFHNTKLDIEEKILEIIPDKKIITILKDGNKILPSIMLLTYKTCMVAKESKKQYQRALEFAVSIELAHRASLIHDDIIDEDKQRKGKPAYYIKKGVPNALLTGHKMLVIGFNIAINHGEKISDLYVNTWNKILNEQLKEVNTDQNELKNDIFDKTTENDLFREYNKKDNLKTTSIFLSVCKGGAIEANASKKTLSIITNYGREIGIAFQIANDLNNLQKGEINKNSIIPILNYLENKKYEIDSLNIRSIKRKISKNSLKIEELYDDEITRHIIKAEELSKSEIIYKSQYKNLLTETPKYIIKNLLNK